jgi:hypothetical protein
MERKSRATQHMTVTVGERRWIWAEAVFLAGVQDVGTKGGPKTEEELIQLIKLAALEQKGIPLKKQHVILQPVNNREMDPQLPDDKKAEVVYAKGLYVTIWIQYLPETLKKERLRARPNNYAMDAEHRNYMITASTSAGVDSSLLGKRWGTTATEREPPVDADRFAMKAIAHR